MRSFRLSFAPSRAIALTLAILQSASPARAAEPARAGEDGSSPAASGLIERSEVRLMLLEVEAVDKEGHPLRGLTQADFVVILGGRRAVIESVDNLCDCAGGAPDGSGGPATRASGSGAEASSSPSGSEVDPTGPAADAGIDRFVLYLDFGQMALDGRHEAIEAARRWLTTIRRPGEEAMIAAYVTDQGVGVLQPFTDSSVDLLKSLDLAERNLGMVDHFAVQLQRRLEDCDLDPSTCWFSSRQEYDHGRRSLTALQKFLAHLAIEPGRKTILYFHENGLMSPGRIYRQRERDQVNLVDRVGAEATSSRAVIYPVRVGTPAGGHAVVEEENRTLGGNLAEATGGRYNLGPGDLSGLVDRAGRGCRCLYLLGLRPPNRTGNRVYSATVHVRGVTLAPRYRVRYLTEEERWLRNASAALADPLSSRNVAVGAAIVPVEAAEGRWHVAVQVATETDALAFIPQAGARLASWEVGARLASLDGRRKWEMLGTDTLRRESPESASKTLLHERIVENLRPGPYRFSAFIRDRTASLFGGAEAHLTLPNPAEGGIAGPILFRPGRRRIVSGLPLLPARGGGESKASHEAVGASPVLDSTVPRGEAVEVRTWLCPGRSGPPLEGILRFVARGETPAFQLGELIQQPAGQCVVIADRMDTSHLDSGTYTYHLRWPGVTDQSNAERVVSFEVTGAPARSTQRSTAPSH